VRVMYFSTEVGCGLADQEFDLIVIYQCGLTRDLSLFEAGDATEVGEKGLTLRCAHIYLIDMHEAYYRDLCSGGQKVGIELDYSYTI
jgi:hypothetical protein